MSKPWDYIVIGAGSAGCVVANRLGEDRAHRVLVLEAGGSDSNPLLHVPAGILRLSERYKWHYPFEPDHSRHGKSEDWEAGKVIGGTSSINGMVWVRGNRRDYDGWAQQGCTGWDFDSVLPYFKRAETFEGGANVWRGGSGPQHVSFLRMQHELTDTFVAAAQNAGFPFNPDYNGAEQRGVAYGQVSQKRGLRQSSANAYLAPARRRHNVRVETHAFVRRILLDADRVVGVEYDQNGTRSIARCDGEVIVSAGAIASPKILLLSGIGPAAQLRERGIDVHVDLPGVGANLQDHFGIALFFEVDVKTLNREFTPWNVLRGAVDLVVRGRGSATAAFAHAILFDAIGDGDVDYKAIFAPYGLTESEHSAGGATQHKLMDLNAMTIRPTVLNPKARGSISLRSADPQAFPVIRHQYAAEPDDVATMIAVSRRVREVVAAEPMKHHLIREMRPGTEVQSDAEWEEVVRTSAYPGKHPGGTCKMGVDPLAVVDPQLRVHGITGLRVIDMSIVPTLPTGNTNAPAMMFGERGADFILGRSLSDEHRSADRR